MPRTLHFPYVLEIQCTPMKKTLLMALLAIAPMTLLAADLPVKLKKGQAYQAAKPALLAAGWKVIDFDAGQEHPEIYYCQQGGLGRCGIALTDGAGKYLNITTNNDGYEIIGWQVSGKVPM